MKYFIRKIADVRYVPRLIAEDLFEAVRKQAPYIGRRKSYTAYFTREGFTTEEKKTYTMEEINESL